MIQAVKLRFSYRDREVLNGIDFIAEKGKVTVLMGRNGAGKTTLLKHFNGLLKPSSGKVLIDGEEVKYDRKSLLKVRKKVFYVFQNPDDQILSPTVWQDVAFGPRNLGLSGNDLEKVVKDALKAVGLEGYEKRLCSTLSGGEKRKLAIASALAMNSDYYIMDEPSANVDGDGFEMIVETVEKLRSDGKGVVVSTHDLDLAKAVGDRFYFMENGRIVWSGEKFNYRIARKLGIRTFAFGKVILSDQVNHAVKKVDYVAVQNGDASIERSFRIISGNAVFERAVLKAIEGYCVLFVCDDVERMAEKMEKYPIDVEILEE